VGYIDDNYFVYSDDVDIGVQDEKCNYGVYYLHTGAGITSVEEILGYYPRKIMGYVFSPLYNEKESSLSLLPTESKNSWCDT
jgi:hypothetical protein